MKGSVVVLLGCLAFSAAPSHSYSVKFISEDDQVANRQDTQSGSPSPDVGSTGDVVEASDISAGENKTVTVDGDAKPGNESDSGDAQTEKSIIRKRDTRSWVSDTVYDAYDGMGDTVSKEDALNYLRVVRDNGERCFKQILKYLEENDVEKDSSSYRGSKVIFNRSSMIKWLKMMQFSMSDCLRLMIEPYLNNTVPPFYDDDTPNSARPRSEMDSLTGPELLSWFGQIGRSLEKCLTEMVPIPESLFENKNDPVQRSSESFSDLLAELIEILSQIDGRSFAAGEAMQMLPPIHSAPPYLNPLPILPAYKKGNYLDKAGGYPQYSTLPGLVYEYPPPPPPPPFGYPKEKPNPILPNYAGFRGESEQASFIPGMATLPEDVSALPNSKYSLLDLVLDKIYSKLQGNVPPGGNAPAESLGDDASGLIGLYRGPRDRQSLGMGMPGMYYPDISQCVQECMNRTTQWRMVNRG